MDLLNDNVKKLYWKFRVPSIGGAMVVSLYNFVDTIAIGQGVGPNGTAACAVFLPLFWIAEFIGLLCGIGGSVLMSEARGSGDHEKGNAYFTAALIFCALLTGIAWIASILWKETLFRFFGADDVIMPYALRYGSLIASALPFFVMATFLSCFVRNDGAPTLTMVAVCLGAVSTMTLDYILVFPMNMGMLGAACATTSGSVVQVIIMGSYFFSKKCSLRIVKPAKLLNYFREIIVNGFGSGFSILAVMVLTFIANNQIMTYSDADSLAVYGMICTLSTLFLSIYTGVGQACQPIASSNFGANLKERYMGVRRMGLITCMILGVVFSGLCLLIPEQLTMLFMQVTPGVMEVAPFILRVYGISFLPLAFTAFLSIYLQSVMRPVAATVISVCRGLAVSGVLLYILPAIMGGDGIWYAFTVAEFLVAADALVYMIRADKAVSSK